MGNYIYKVPSNSHTSAAAVRDGGRAAALPAADSEPRAGARTLALPVLPPRSLLERFLPRSLTLSCVLRPPVTATSPLPSTACVICKMEPQPGADSCCSSRRPCRPLLQTRRWTVSLQRQQRKLSPLRARHPTRPGPGFSSKLCATVRVSKRQLSCAQTREGGRGTLGGWGPTASSTQ